MFINDVANANMSTGITIQQLAEDNEAFALKSTDVAHAMTGYTEADTYFKIGKAEATSGGAGISGFKDADGTAAYALYFLGLLGEAADTTTSTSSKGVTHFVSRITNGSTGATTVAADGNAFQFSNGTSGLLTIKGDGDLHGADTSIAAYDSYDDAQLVRALEQRRSKSEGATGFIKSKWDDFVKYGKEELVSAGIISNPEDGASPLLNYSQLLRLHNGAIWQGYTREMELQERVHELETRLVALEGGK